MFWWHLANWSFWLGLGVLAWYHPWFVAGWIAASLFFCILYVIICWKPHE